MKNIYLASLLLLFSVSSIFGQTNEYTYLALGDSYTIGESVKENQRWPVLLTKQLNQKGIDLNDPTIIAKTGWTTLDLKTAIKKADLNPSYDLVSLLIGVNDQYQGIDVSAYPANFTFLLNKAIRLAGNKPGHVLVLSIPDYGVTPFGQGRNPRQIDRQLKGYNAINKKISEEMGVIYVDVFPASKKALKNKALVASDGLHPSGKMYQLWVDEVMPLLLPEIQSW